MLAIVCSAFPLPSAACCVELDWYYEAAWLRDGKRCKDMHRIAELERRLSRSRDECNLISCPHAVELALTHTMLTVSRPDALGKLVASVDVLSQQSHASVEQSAICHDYDKAKVLPTSIDEMRYDLLV